MTKQIFFYIFLFVSLIGCEMNSEPQHIVMSDKIVSQYLKDMKKFHGLECFGNGGAFLDQVNEIILSFYLREQKSQGELRELMVIITEDLLKRYNKSEDIRPHLKNYPFTAKNLSLSILLRDENGVSIHNEGDSNELLRWVFLMSGEIAYDFRNDDKPYNQEAYRETYEEALAIVQRQRPDLFPGAHN